MRRIPYDIHITSKSAAQKVMIALLEYNGHMTDCYRFPNSRFRYIIRIHLWEGTENGFMEYAGAKVVEVPKWNNTDLAGEKE